MRQGAGKPQASRCRRRRSMSGPMVSKKPQPIRWGFFMSAVPPSIFREHHGTRACMLFRRPAANSLRIVRDLSPILTESPMTASIRRASSLRPGQFKHLIRVASVTGRIPERDVMLLWLTHTTGVRVTELALLEVADVLYPSGAIKHRSVSTRRNRQGLPTAQCVSYPSTMPCRPGRLDRGSLAAPLGHFRC